MAIADLFFVREIGFGLETAEQKKLKAGKMWEVLLNAGFALHPQLEQLYRKQRTCLFCGGAVMTYQTGDHWEERCDSCNYMYDED